MLGEGCRGGKGHCMPCFKPKGGLGERGVSRWEGALYALPGEAADLADLGRLIVELEAPPFVEGNGLPRSPALPRPLDSEGRMRAGGGVWTFDD